MNYPRNYLSRKYTLQVHYRHQEKKNTLPSVSKVKLKRGETVNQYSSSGIMIAKWRDKCEVLHISMQYEHKMVDFIHKRGITLRKPLPVVQYNCYICQPCKIQAFQPTVRPTGNGVVHLSLKCEKEANGKI